MTRTRLPIANGYELLASVLDDALAQAQSGKGKERHARGEPFEDQLIVLLNEKLGSIHGQLYQALKKTLEADRLDDQAAIRDLLGAINYLAAAVIQIRRGKKVRR